MAATSNGNTTATTGAASHEEEDESGLAEWIALSEQIATALDPKVSSTTLE